MQNTTITIEIHSLFAAYFATSNETTRQAGLALHWAAHCATAPNPDPAWFEMCATATQNAFFMADAATTMANAYYQA